MCDHGFCLVAKLLRYTKFWARKPNEIPSVKEAPDAPLLLFRSKNLTRLAD